MELTRSHVENIRNQAKKQGINPTADQIRTAVIECYPDADDTTEFDTQVIPGVVDILLAQQPTLPLAPSQPKAESNIVLSEGKKQDLVAGAAREAGLNLVASEVKSIATNIASGFTDREELLNAVMGAIVAYAEQRIDAQSAALKRASERIRRKVNEGNGNARDAFASIDQVLEATNNDFKSELESITALFPTAASWN